MDKFIAYIMVGGLLFGFIDKERVDQCGDHFPLTDFAIGVVLYPAMIVSALITKSTGEDPSCK